MAPTVPGSERLRTWLRRRVVAALAARADLHTATTDALEAAKRSVAQADARLAALDGRTQRLARALDRRDGPFTLDMSVDEAWRRHPGARAAFAARHLPDCDGCAVRFDETLAEVADAYGFDPAALIDALNRLLDSADGRPAAPRTL